MEILSHLIMPDWFQPIELVRVANAAAVIVFTSFNKWIVHAD
jgi:hypothetical protein